MRKFFLFICTALMSVSMFAAQTTVTISPSDIHSGTSCKKDGVTISFAGFDDVDKDITGPISFSTSLGQFTKIEIQAFGTYVKGDGWTGDNNKKTWTGKASTVESTGNISKLGHITCTIKIPYAGEGTEESPYLIATAEEWDTLASKVNAGTTYSGVFFKLTDDIAISTMVGSDADHAFHGTFDGNGHTISFSVAGAQVTEEYIAPFRRINGATIKGIRLTGDVVSSYRFSGGIVAYAKGTNTVTDCVNSTHITNNDIDNASNGGIVGMVGGNGTINITGCVFNGQMNGTTNSDITWSGILGLCNSGCTANISDCLVDPENAVERGNTIYRSSGTTHCSNCYYTQAIGNTQGKPALSITGASGVTVENAGEPTEYTVSGITAYGTGIQYDGVLYGGREDNIILHLSGYSFYSASAGTLSNNGDGTYTLSMLNTSVVISGNDTPTAIDPVTGNPSPVTLKIIRNGILFINRDGKTYTVTGTEVR